MSAGVMRAETGGFIPRLTAAVSELLRHPEASSDHLLLVADWIDETTQHGIGLQPTERLHVKLLARLLRDDAPRFAGRPLITPAQVGEVVHVN